MTPLAIVALLSLAGISHAEESSVDSLLALMEGTFVAADQQFVYRRSLVTAPALGTHVVYLQVNRGATRDLYRQRILILRDDIESCSVIETAWTLAEPERFEDAPADDPLFGQLTPDDLDPSLADGCEQRWRRLGDAWTGRVDPETCRIVSKRTGRPRRIESESHLSATGLRLVERGFDDSGKQQLFGTPPGEWLELHRREALVGD